MKKKSIQALVAYETKMKTMGFEETLLLPPPVHATSGSKRIPGITRALDTITTNVSTMDADADGGVEDFIAEIGEDSKADEEDEMLWPGFQQIVQGIGMGVKMEPKGGESEMESSPLYRMDEI